MSPTGRVCESSMIMWCPVWIMGYRLLCFFMLTAASLKFGKSLPVQPWTCMEFQPAPVPETRGSSYSPMKIANWTRCPIQMVIHCFVWNWGFAYSTGRRHGRSQVREGFYSALQVNPNHALFQRFISRFLPEQRDTTKNWAVENVLWFAMFLKAFHLVVSAFFQVYTLFSVFVVLEPRFYRHA